MKPEPHAPIIRHIVAMFRSPQQRTQILTLPPELQCTATEMHDRELQVWINDIYGTPSAIKYLTTAISIQQPWAWAILEAGKNVENRSRVIAKAGWHYLHTGKTIDEKNYHRAAGIVAQLNDSPYPPEFMPPIGFNRPLPPVSAPITMPPIKELQTGGIIGAIHINHWTDTSQSPWFFGPKAAEITAALPLAFIPCLGKLGAFYPTFL